MSIQTDIQSLTPGAVIEMFEIDASPYGLGFLRFCPHASEGGGDIVWQGNVYTRFPIVAGGFEKSSSGTLPRPTLTASNIQGLIGALFKLYNNLLGCKVTRRRTLVKYLDKVNFISGLNPTADPSTYFPDEVYYIDRKAAETPSYVQVETTVSWDTTGVKIPLRQFIRDTCMWEYRGADGNCGYAGPPVADEKDLPVSSILLDRCSKHMSGCRLRYPKPLSLPASFFPGVGIVG